MPPKRQRSNSQPSPPTHLAQVNPYVPHMSYLAAPAPKRQRTLSTGSYPVPHRPFMEFAGQASMGESEWDTVASPMSAGPEYQVGAEGLEEMPYNQSMQGTALGGLVPMHPEFQPQNMPPHTYHPFAPQPEQPQLHYPQPQTPLVLQLDANVLPPSHPIPGPQAASRPYDESRTQPYPQSLHNAYSYPSDYQYTQAQSHYNNLPQSHHRAQVNQHIQPQSQSYQPRPRPQPLQPAHNIPYAGQAPLPFIHHQPPSAPHVQAQADTEQSAPLKIYVDKAVQTDPKDYLLYPSPAPVLVPVPAPVSEKPQPRKKSRSAKGNAAKGGESAPPIRFVESEKLGKSNLGQGYASTSVRGKKERAKKNNPTIVIPRLASDPSVPTTHIETPHRRVQSEGDARAPIASASTHVRRPGRLSESAQGQAPYTPLSATSSSSSLAPPLHRERSHTLAPFSQNETQNHRVSVPHYDDVSTPGSCPTTALNTPDTPAQFNYMPNSGTSYAIEGVLFALASPRYAPDGTSRLQRRHSRGKEPTQYARSPLGNSMALPFEGAMVVGNGEAGGVTGETQMVQDQAQGETGICETQIFSPVMNEADSQSQQQQGSIQQSQHQAQGFFQPQQHAQPQSQQPTVLYQPTPRDVEMQHSAQVPPGPGPAQHSVENPKRARTPSKAAAERATKKRRPSQDLITTVTSGGSGNVVAGAATVVSPVFDANGWHQSGFVGVESTSGEVLYPGQQTEGHGQVVAAGFPQADAGMKGDGFGGDVSLQVGLPRCSENQPPPPILFVTQATPSISTQEVLSPAASTSLELSWGPDDRGLLLDGPSGFEWLDTVDQEASSADKRPSNLQDQATIQPTLDAFVQPSSILSATAVAGPSSHLPIYDEVSGQLGSAMWGVGHPERHDSQVMFPLNTPAPGSQTQNTTLPEPWSESDVIQGYDFEKQSW
ncbi:hypothetical protein BDV93DRAFT_604641 [Ceratobasidium sp. AG-I]|nr:hypothetical protein BDV93DRAFT_604641 [Ceratobasidium sp. AG-I]